MRARIRHRHIVPDRDAELKGVLERRRQELLRQIQRRARHVRATVCDHRPGVDSEGATSDPDLDDDVDLAVLQMGSEMLGRIDDALLRIEAGTFGYCVDCATEIAGARLRALPFAIRCKDCEEAREVSEQRQHHRSPYHVGSPPG
jgi:DnaK suppressor protein